MSLSFLLLLLNAFIGIESILFTKNVTNRLIKKFNVNSIVNESKNLIFDIPYGTGRITGYIPSDPDTTKTYPLFVWVTGTQMNHWTNDDIIYCNYMANNDFVAVSLDYQFMNVFPLSCGGPDSTLNTQWIGKAKGLFDNNNPFSALSILCDPNSEFSEYTSHIECSKGIVLAGFSQGAQLISLAGNFGFDKYIKGIYEQGGGWRVYQGIISIPFDCLRYNNTIIDKQRIRSCVGANDAYFGVNPVGVYGQQQMITNYCIEGNDTNVIYNCLQNDGSGFYIVQDFEPETGDAVHCYAYQDDDCHANDGSPIFDNYYNPGNTQSINTWAMSANLDWLIGKVYGPNK